MSYIFKRGEMLALCVEVARVPPETRSHSEMSTTV